ncbi:coiled-coil domain-containing protein [Patescibacteria group bacterium]
MPKRVRTYHNSTFIFILVVVGLISAGVVGATMYIAMQTKINDSSQQIDDLNFELDQLNSEVTAINADLNKKKNRIKNLQKKISNAEEVEYTYTNDVYGFSIKLTEKWNGFLANAAYDTTIADTKKKKKAVRPEATFEILLPTTDINYPLIYGQPHASMFSVAVYIIDEFEKTKDDITGSEVARDKKYVYIASYVQDTPTDLKERVDEMPDLADGLKLN